ncbi:phage tail spike protein [Streptococcus suis]|uniref:phage tail spike protein n=1 Tax=Streptococcus suis TaxID=1307 RepID=UPI00209C5E84|nr:phage tail spike protein [Streptococcus suis]MCO8208494.1 gp58-like family protein [Streptococcus suis]
MIYLKDGNIPLNLAYDDDIVQEANSTYQLSFKFPLTDGKWNLLKREVFLLADDLHGEQEFFIFEVKKAKGYVQVYAKQVATLLNYYSINSISVDRVPGQTVMTALAGSVKRPCPFTFFSDIMDRHTFNESNVSVMDALVKEKHSIVGQWGGDLVRDKYQVKLLKNGGIENESLFMYKKNLSNYEESENINNLKTRLHLKKIIQGQSEDEEDRVLAVTVDSPLISQYSQIYEADIEVNDQDVTDEASLTAYGKRYFSSTLCDLVENAINLDVKGKSDVAVKMFDTVSVFHERFDVDLRLKITSYHFAPMSKRLKSIGFGKVSQSFGSTVASMVAGSVDKATGKLSASFERKLQKEIDNANRHFDAEFNKRFEEINDGLEQSKAEAERYADTIKQEIATEINALDTAIQAQSEEHDRQVADILSKTQSVEALANQAKSDAASAIARAVQYKNEAIAEATRLDAVERQATETKLTTVKSQAISEATRLVETAKSLLSGQISNVSTDLSQTKEAIKLLATRATVDALTGRVSSAESTLQVQAGEIASRVKTSDFDQAKQRISTAESLITQVGNRITTEIAETKGLIPTEVNQNLFDVVFSDLRATGGASFVQSDDGWIEVTIKNRWSGFHWYYSDDINPSKKQYVVSYEAYLVDTVAETARLESDFGSPDQLTLINKTPKRYTVVLNRPVNIFNYINFVCDSSETGKKFRIRNIKLEEGIIATPYIAPFATTTDIENVKTTITQTAEGQEQLSTKLTETDNKVTSAETNIKQLLKDVSSKVSQTEYNKLEGIVDTQSTLIAQNTSQISLKAEQTYVDNVKSTVDNAKVTASDALAKAQANAQSITQAKAELKVATDKIASLVTKTDFNAATGRLSTLETSVEQHAEEITKRLTSTQVEQAITGKGYQTKSQVDSNITGRGYVTSSALQPYAKTTTVQTLITETAGSFERQITETRGLIPTEVNQNLFDAVFSDLRATGGASFVQSDDGWIEVTIKNRWSGFHWYYSDDINPSKKQYVVSYEAYLVDTVAETARLESDFGSPDQLTLINKTPKRYTVVLNRPVNIFNYINFVCDSSETGKKFRIRNIKLEEGIVATPYIAPFPTTVLFNAVKDTVDAHKQLIGNGDSISQAIQSANKFERYISSGGDIYRVIETAKGLVTEVSGTNGLKTQVSTLAGSYAIKNLTKAGDVLGQINLNPDGSVRINEGLISIGDKTYIQDGVISSAKIAGLDAGKIKTGTLDAARIATNSITGSHIAFDQAFFNGFTANEAYLKQLFAKSAFITSVQAVTLSASQITSGVMRATNNAMEVNLNAGQILYYTDQAALKRVLSGYPTQFVKFATGTVTGKGTAGVTVIGSNRWNSESSNDGGFVGIRAWNGSNIDQIDVVGDTVRLASSTFESADGWTVNTLPGKLDIDAFNADHRASSKIKVGDLWLWKNATTYSSMRDTINLIIDNLQLLHNNKSTERAYSYTLPAKV